MKKDQEVEAIELTELLDKVATLENEKSNIESRYQDALDIMNGKDLVIERQWNDLQAWNDLINKISERSQNLENENERLKKKKNELINELKLEKEVNVKLV